MDDDLTAHLRSRIEAEPDIRLLILANETSVLMGRPFDLVLDHLLSVIEAL